MNHFRKLIALALTLSLLFTFSIVFVSAGAASNVTVTFSDLPYDIAADPTSPTRTDWPAISSNQGYSLGKEYMFAFPEKDEDGRIMYVVRDGEYAAQVAVGGTIEFKVAVASYIESSTVKILTYPTGTPAASLYKAKTGEPKSDYIITSSSQSSSNLVSSPNAPRYLNAETGEYEILEGYTLFPNQTGIYGLKPDKDLTVNVSEYHMYNTGFALSLEGTADYTLAKYLYNPNGAFSYVYDKNGEPEFSSEYSAGRVFYGVYGVDYLDSADPNHYKVWRDNDYANKIIYYGEPVYIGIEIPKTTAKKTYHHDTYTLSYSGSSGLLGMIPGVGSVTLKDEQGYTDAFVFGYETDHSYVDIYKLENLTKNPTFTAEGISELDFSDLADLISGDASLSDLTGKTTSGLLSFFVKFFNLIKKILAGLGVKIG